MLGFFGVTSRKIDRPSDAIDFMKFRWISLVLSVLIFGTFVGTYIYKSMNRGWTFNYSVDFTGGIQTLLKFSKPVEAQRLLSVLKEAGWEGAVSREFEPDEHIIRVKKEVADVRAEAEKIRVAVADGLGSDYTVELLQTDSVGGIKGSELWRKSFTAIIIALIMMALYITARFRSFSFAAGAVAALCHDAVVILAIFLLFDKEISISVIGAILVILGYSINDTIVIFSRVRENVDRFPKASMYDLVNLSITETLSRTILTSISTLLVVIALFLFASATLRDLSVALAIGIIFGTYSTIFIANPVLLLFGRSKKIITKD